MWTPPKITTIHSYIEKYGKNDQEHRLRDKKTNKIISFEITTKNVKEKLKKIDYFIHPPKNIDVFNKDAKFWIEIKGILKKETIDEVIFIYDRELLYWYRLNEREKQRETMLKKSWFGFKKLKEQFNIYKINGFFIPGQNYHPDFFHDDMIDSFILLQGKNCKSNSKGEMFPELGIETTIYEIYHDYEYVDDKSKVSYGFMTLEDLEDSKKSPYYKAIIWNKECGLFYRY